MHTVSDGFLRGFGGADAGELFDASILFQEFFERSDKVAEAEGEGTADDDSARLFIFDNVGETEGDALGDFLVFIFAADRSRLDAKASLKGFTRSEVFPLQFLALVFVKSVTRLEMGRIRLDEFGLFGDAAANAGREG